MSLIRKSAKVLNRTYLLQKIDIPQSVTVETNGELLTVSGALGTVRTDLSKLDTTGSTALKIEPENRRISIASCDKEFFPTISTLIQNSISVGYSCFPVMRTSVQLWTIHMKHSDSLPRFWHILNHARLESYKQWFITWSQFKTYSECEYVTRSIQWNRDLVMCLCVLLHCVKQEAFMELFIVLFIGNYAQGMRRSRLWMLCCSTYQL